MPDAKWSFDIKDSPSWGRSYQGKFNGVGSPSPRIALAVPMSAVITVSKITSSGNMTGGAYLGLGAPNTRPIWTCRAP